MNHYLAQPRKLFISFLLMLGVTAMMAAPITQKSAERIALRFFTNSLRSLTPVETVHLEYAPAVSSLRSSQQKSFYIFNRGQDDGFVIVSGDDQLPEVLGYSERGHFSLSASPIQLTEMLKAYEVAMQYYVTHDPSEWSYNFSSLRQDNAFKSEIKPLLKDIEWNQDYPWNYMCPKGENMPNLPVGCVATAAAQIMRQYNWPDHGEGTYYHKELISGREHKIDFNTSYDWAHMPERFEDKTKATEQERNAVAKLCYHVGVAMDMMYSEEASGTFIGNVVRALRENFRYDKSVICLDRLAYETVEWEGIIKKELNEGRSVFYGGMGAGGGHAFVCDGYDEKGLFHINWGWGGKSNGYFRLNLLNPPALGIGGGAGGGFNYDQQMIINIKPDKNGDSEIAEPEVVGYDFKLRYNKPKDMLFSPELTVYLTSEKTYSGSFRLHAVNVDDSSDEFFSKESPSKDFIFMPLTTNVKREQRVGHEIPGIILKDVKLKPNAKYLVFAEIKGRKQFVPVKHMLGKKTSAFITTDEKGKFKEIIYDTNEPNVTLIEGSFSGQFLGYEKSTLEFKVNNTGEEYRGDVVFYYKQSDKKYWKQLDVQLYNIAKGDNLIQLDIDQMPAKPNSEIDLQVEVQGKTIMLGKNLPVQKADKVRPALILTYNGELDNKNEVLLNPFAGNIKGVTVKNISEEAFKPFRASCYIMITDGLNDYGITDAHRYFFNRPFTGEKEIPLSFRSEELVKLLIKKNSAENNPLAPLPAGTKLYYRIFIFLSDLNNGDVINALSDDLPHVDIDLFRQNMKPAEIKLYTTKAQGQELNLNINPVAYYEKGQDEPKMSAIEIIGAKKEANGKYKVESQEIVVKGCVSSLDCSSSGITKIELNDNQVLDRLICSNNQLVSLDISKQSKLRYLDCSNNQLNKLILNRNIDSLYCQNNELVTIEAPDFMVTRELIATNNKINNISLTYFSGLINLDLSNNKLQSIDLKDLSMLNKASLNHNEITSIVAPKAVQIENKDEKNFMELQCYDNKIDAEGFEQLAESIGDRKSELNVGNIVVVDGKANKEENKFSNSLKELFLQKNWLAQDYNGGIVIPFDEKTLSTESLVSEIVKVYPNPAHHYTNIVGAKGNSSVIIYSMDGVKIYEGQTDVNGKLRIDLTNLIPQTYVINVDNHSVKLKVE
ncbi:C10 family peptidase [Falsiporphyromonas endometrii]|uniref:C10 family peptidase n=1 Tax=Falsiporphyromonas endometrii TaxID=1387297 RepID=A0ABV9K6P4_9PORP